MIPFIAPEFPQAQRDAMSFGTKVPVVYAMVQLSNWRAWQRLGTLRDQLTRLLGPGGFDPARDIRAITINRWGHGYAWSTDGRGRRSGRTAHSRSSSPASR